MTFLISLSASLVLSSLIVYFAYFWFSCFFRPSSLLAFLLCPNHAYSSIFWQWLNVFSIYVQFFSPVILPFIWVLIKRCLQIRRCLLPSQWLSNTAPPSQPHAVHISSASSWLPHRSQNHQKHIISVPDLGYLHALVTHTTTWFLLPYHCLSVSLSFCFSLSVSVFPYNCLWICLSDTREHIKNESLFSIHPVIFFVSISCKN